MVDQVVQLFRNVRKYYNAINPATLSGAIDVIVVEQPDGTYCSTPFHVRFGKYGVFSHSNKYVDIMVNDVYIDLKMKLGDSGVAYFVEEHEGNAPDYMITSPVPETVAPQQAVDTEKVLGESAKILEDHVLPRIRRNSLDDKKLDILRELNDEKPVDLNQEQTLAEVKQKLRVPFSSSIFSNRRNRSLPDLTALQSTASKTNIQKHSVFLPHSLSTGSELRSSEERTQKSQKNRRKKSRVETRPVTSPIDIVVETDNDSDLDSSLSSSNNSTPTPSYLDPHDVADGALSDSEVDCQRKNNDHCNEVTEWKWGQLPETRENQAGNSTETAPKKETSSWSWFSWGRKPQEQAPAPSEEGIFLTELIDNSKSDPKQIEKYLGKSTSGSFSVDSGTASRGTSHPASPTGKNSFDHDLHHEEATPTQEVPNSLFGASSPIDINKTKRVRSGSGEPKSVSSCEDIYPLSEDDLESVEDEGGKIYVRSLRLSSERLKTLGLVRGANECRFSITTMYQGTTWCACNIYLYKWYEKIVISDIDGTITKSDVLGHVIPAIGGTWAHSGVADLYTIIKNNGYKMVYLSSRAIGQSHTTKQYLKSVAQNSRQLPDGPVLLSPTSVLMAFRREVIERRPEEFKIAALSDLKKLFPVQQPYFAGFGNRDTDVKSYTAVGIPATRILIIDPSGHVRRSDSLGYVSSYSSMATETVDYLFPPLPSYNIMADPNLVDGFDIPREHSTFAHWMTREVDDSFLSDEDLLKYEGTRNQKAK